MIAEIAPLKRLPVYLSTFSYTIPKKFANKIRVGQIVEIPFKKNFINGVIIKIDPKKISDSYRLKPISKIITQDPYLTKEQLILFKIISHYYMVSIATALKSFVPPVPKRIQKNPYIPFIGTEISTDFKKTQLNKKILEQIIKAKNGKNFSLQYTKTSSKYTLYIKLTSDALNHRQQIAIITAQKSKLANLANILTSAFKKEDITLVSGELNKSQSFLAWQKIKNNSAKIILGTRIAITFPFNSLRYLIIDDEQDENFKQSDQNPRYDSRQVAKEVAKLHCAKLIFTSIQPPLLTYYQIKKGNIKQIQLDNKQNKTKSHFHIIDLGRTLHEPYRSLLSQPLKNQIKTILEQKKQVLLYYNRLGWAKHIACLDCKYLFKCPHCLLPIPVHFNEKQLQCHHCNFTQEIPLSCPYCQGQNLKYFGKGLEQLEKECEKEFSPNNIIKLDKNSEKIYNQKILDTANIIIGTSFILHKINFSHIGLIGLVNIDDLYILPDYNTEEKALQLLLYFKYKAVENKAKLLIQTYKPKQNLLSAVIQENNINNFYEQELRQRKQFHYPPFSQLIKLIFIYKDEKIGLKEIKKIRQTLVRNLKIPIYEPYLSYKTKIRNYYHFYLVIKATSIQTKENLRQLIIKKKIDCLIDVDPISLI